MSHLFKAKGVANKLVSCENEKEIEIFRTFFRKPIAWLVKEIDRKTLGGLESSGNKLSHEISLIFLAYFIWFLRALKHKVVGQKKVV